MMWAIRDGIAGLLEPTSVVLVSGVKRPTPHAVVRIKANR